MLTEIGRVVAVKADGLWVETRRRSSCGTCAGDKGCGLGLLTSIAKAKPCYFRILPDDRVPAHYNINDQVEVSVPEGAILRGSFVAYVLPLLGLLGGAMAAVNLLRGNQDSLAVLGALCGLTLGFALVRWHGLRHRHDPDFHPVLVDRTHAEPVTLL